MCQVNEIVDAINITRMYFRLVLLRFACDTLRMHTIFLYVPVSLAWAEAFWVGVCPLGGCFFFNYYYM